ncbi:AMP-binding protein [Halogeometricum luteum]|uniref:Long-chain fatty acid--CoA ligase n=1 Tax=Halogeometricum luteum TaxID=2950537 RepID=A0ABU2FW02_9EURY|nr:AMP-binding protein [Halogeometricum sp. S3BR5-2]MDS0292713.1 long-chain fatty acid--CoA ligase [Halogeometricum sp. S3BR5-2]
MTSDAPPPRPADPTVLGDLVARDRRTSAPALRAEDAGRSYSYHDFVTTTYKAGNVLRYLGVRGGETVAVASDPQPEPVLAFYGAAQLGAATAFGPDPAGSADAGDPPRATLVGVDREPEFDLPPGRKLAIYGGPPERPATTHWEQEVWSENPAVHPATVAADDPALRADGRTYSHRELLEAAASAVESGEMEAGESVVVRDSLTRPGTVAAGLVAPILVGAVIVFPGPDTVGDVAVGGGPEERSVAPGDLF